jgi:hypothetical protein
MLYLDDEFRYNDEIMRSILKTKHLDTKLVHDFIYECLKNSKETLKISESYLSFKDKMETKITHCHVEILLSILRARQFRS